VCFSFSLLLPPAGVQVITGMNLVEAIGAGAYYGAGMEFTVGGGRVVYTR